MSFFDKFRNSKSLSDEELLAAEEAAAAEAELADLYETIINNQANH